MSTIARTAAHSVPAHCPPAHCLLDRSLPHRARMHMVWISYEHTRGACLCRRTHGPDKEQPHQGQPDLHRPGTEWAGPAMFQGNSRDDSCCTTDGRSTWLCSRAYRPAPALCRFRQRLPQWTRRAPFVSFKHHIDSGFAAGKIIDTWTTIKHAELQTATGLAPAARRTRTLPHAPAAARPGTRSDRCG